METTEKKGVTSFAIKVIAIVTMFIDHCGAVFVERKMSLISLTVPDFRTDPTYVKLEIIDGIMRSIGRIARGRPPERPAHARWGR